MRTLVTGATGLLGPYLLAEAARHGPALGLARSRSDIDCDLGDAASVQRAVDGARPDCVLHAAAMTNVDQCEQQPEAAHAANAEATRNLVRALPPETVLVYFSTDQVYGMAPGLKSEGMAGPVNAYGRSKLAGEDAARRHRHALVLRCNMFGPSRTPGRLSFSDWIIDALARRQPVTFFSDVWFSPLQFSTLAATAFECVRQGLRDTYNVASRQGLTKRDFAHMIASHLRLPLDAARDGTSSQVAGRALRPTDLRMDVQLLEAALGRPMPTLQEEVARL